MNTVKIVNLLELIGREVEKDVFNDEEYLIFIANLLFKFGQSGIKDDAGLAEVNINNSNSVELALNQNPNNVYLSALLQGHALIKWSESCQIG